MNSLEQDLARHRQKKEEEVAAQKRKEQQDIERHQTTLRTAFLEGMKGAFKRLTENTDVTINKMFNIAEFKVKNINFYLCFEEATIDDPNYEFGYHPTTIRQWKLKRDSMVNPIEVYIGGGWNVTQTDGDLYDKVIEAVDHLLKPEMPRW